MQRDVTRSSRVSYRSVSSARTGRGYYPQPEMLGGHIAVRQIRQLRRHVYCAICSHRLKYYSHFNLIEVTIGVHNAQQFLYLTDALHDNGTRRAQTFAKEAPIRIRS